MSTPSNQPGSYDAGASAGNPQQYGQQPYGQGHDQPRTPYPAYPGPGGYGPADGGPLGYLNGAGAGFGQAVKDGLRNLVTWRGRASRSAYWWFTLFSVIIFAIASIIVQESPVAGIIVWVLAGIPVWLAGLALQIRRLHDTSRSGWWWWIGIIPFAGGIVLLVFMLLPGTPGPNRYNTAQ
jgi:uncharacterized membrane protein YhaH (DUF805 family)